MPCAVNVAVNVVHFFVVHILEPKHKFGIVTSYMYRHIAIDIIMFMNHQRRKSARFVARIVLISGNGAFVLSIDCNV